MPQRIPPKAPVDDVAPDAPTGTEQPKDEAPVATRAELERDKAVLEKMRAHFAAQPKRRVRTRNDEFVQVNGYSFFIKAGEWVNVPEDIAQILEDADRI